MSACDTEHPALLLQRHHSVFTIFKVNHLISRWWSGTHIFCLSVFVWRVLLLCIQTFSFIHSTICCLVRSHQVCVCLCVCHVLLTLWGPVYTVTLWGLTLCIYIFLTSGWNEPQTSSRSGLNSQTCWDIFILKWLEVTQCKCLKCVCLVLVWRYVCIHCCACVCVWPPDVTASCRGLSHKSNSHQHVSSFLLLLLLLVLFVHTSTLRSRIP